MAFTKTTFDIEQAQRAHAELYSKTEISFIEYEKKLSEIEGVKSIEKFQEIQAFADKVQKFAESIHGIVIKNHEVLDDRL